jgi:hypothetical protein
MMLGMDLTTAPMLEHPAAGPGTASRARARSELDRLLDGPPLDRLEHARERRPGYGPGGPDRDPDGPDRDPGGAGGDPGGRSQPVLPPPVEQQLDAAVAAIVATDPRPRQAAGELAGLAHTLAAMDRLAAHAVTLARRLDGRRAAAEEGMSVDGALRLHTRAAGSDISMVLTAADRLATMPAIAGLFQTGVLSWGHVRALITGTRRMPTTQRDALDRYLGAHADQLAQLDTDRLSWAIDDAIEDHRPTRNLQRQAETRDQHDTLTLLGQLDGTGEIHGRFNPESFAALTARLQTEADTPHATPCPGPSPGDSDSDSGLPAEPAPTRSQQYAAALLRLLHPDRTGTGSTGGGAPVRFTVIIDTDRITDTAAGTIQTTVKGRPPRIVRRAIDRIACDAALDVVLRHGTDLIAARRYAPDITAATRRAVIARDQGCRFPTCTAPPSWCDTHHVTPRATSDDHHLTNLVLLCRRHHTLIHRRSWHQTLHPDGTYRLRRRGRTWTTLPRRHQQLPPPTRTPPRPRRPHRPRTPGRSRTTRRPTRRGPRPRSRDPPTVGRRHPVLNPRPAPPHRKRHRTSLSPPTYRSRGVQARP